MTSEAAETGTRDRKLQKQPEINRFNDFTVLCKAERYQTDRGAARDGFKDRPMSL